MILLVHGPAELLRAEAVQQVRAGLAPDPALADLNTARLDGRQITVGDLQFACGTLPFLADRRLVIVERLLARLSAGGPKPKRDGAALGAGTRPQGSSAIEAESRSSDPQSSRAGDAPAGSPAAPLKAWLDVFDRVPDATELVLVEDDVVSGGAVLRCLMELQRAGRARIMVCEKPKRRDLPLWIQERARMRGVQLDGAAVADLADFVGDDLRQLDQELIKLRDFGGGGGVVRREIVRRLVSATRAANVFDMVDALAAGNAAQAGRLLHHAVDLDGEQPLGLLALLGRRFRQLIQAKALASEGLRPAEIAAQLGQAEWQAGRLLEQASRQDEGRLVRALESIVAADEAIKTGKCTDREALDILLAELVLAQA